RQASAANALAAPPSRQKPGLTGEYTIVPRALPAPYATCSGVLPFESPAADAAPTCPSSASTRSIATRCFISPSSVCEGCSRADRRPASPNDHPGRHDTAAEAAPPSAANPENTRAPSTSPSGLP